MDDVSKEGVKRLYMYVYCVYILKDLSVQFRLTRVRCIVVNTTVNYLLFAVIYVCLFSVTSGASSFEKGGLLRRDSF